MSTLDLIDIQKSYGIVTAIEPLSLSVANGELVCLLGPSGSGKSTLLRMIGGFETPTAGKVLIDGVDVAFDPPEKRPTAMVFQSHALWQHMTVFENIAFGLKLRGFGKAEIKRKVEAGLSLVGLQDYGQRRPSQLSGGQRQRVAIARCIVLEPKILLMDEPFASLDQHLRDRLREEVRQIQKTLGITTIFVTHGQDEALSVADRIVVMSMGRIEQVGTPGDIYASPATPFVAGFIGDMNLIPVTVAHGRITMGGIELAAPVADGPAMLAVRPEDIAFAESDASTGGATVLRIVNYGSYFKVTVALESMEWKVQAPKSTRIPEGAVLPLSIGRYQLFRDEQVVFRSEPA
ncbi:ABC transporter ATP-binding protein [Rhizobium paknamense]|uniref:Spermidine/putrescine transport system ATP-binding protein n=1 Tax=Rhizobium paknamense TaxID=1206817 RepID=A0ABU0IEW1_9HYPH|nr:ABC transporter ATP-binding protein [Rhizobium paknamense]MDQ0456780.1 putative spermidine/putrescine transport system ATP-binding protein [Rhizobium paknamense]